MDWIATATTQPAPDAQDARAVSSVLFWLLAIVTGGGALGVVISREIVRTAVSLLVTLVGVAGIYFLLDSEFLAAAQLVIYVGGTLILIIFGVMLTSQKGLEHAGPSLGEVVIGGTVCAVLLAALVLAIDGAFGAGKMPGGARATPEGSAYPVAGLGQALLGDYLVPFELASVLLLVVMIGAAYLAKARRRERSTTVRGGQGRA
ncbi:MAG: NADH-quinone oxidoreductase subunit J [Phycisphaerae bacterium]|nr:NADH-quinone oxidoreductase subunit J [Tepidisphaeraceae bacterium]